jgi:acetate kinase
MNVLVLNCGSSSLKAAVLDSATGVRVARVAVERIGTQGASVRLDGGVAAEIVARDHGAALEVALPALLERVPEAARPRAVGHRVVHGGARFSAPVRVDEEVERTIAALGPLAPLHNPQNLAGIRAARRLLPDLVHVAVFDTAFHATLPSRARHYAIDRELAEKHAVRRYGFHGTSHAYVAPGSRRPTSARTPRELRLVTCHLGNGASVCAIEWGRSVETSMGLTPLEGLVMGTRPGDLDPGVLTHLMRAEGSASTRSTSCSTSAAASRASPGSATTARHRRARGRR